MFRVKKSLRLLYSLKPLSQARPFSSMSTQAQEELEATTQILENIKLHKRLIQEKTEVGRSLSAGVSESMRLDQFEKEQRYELFINKMQRLYKSERNFETKKKKAFKAMAFSTLTSTKPLQLCLSEYNKLSRRGFDCQTIDGSLHELNRVVQGRGNLPKVYGDYQLWEMDVSWRFEKLADDIKFGLTNNSTFFSPHSMQNISRHLGQLGYKNTELIETWLQELQRMGRNEAKEAPLVPFNQAVFGDQLNFVPRHYVFQGFDSNKEFQEHLRTLLSWRNESGEAAKPKSLDAEAAQVELAMKQLIDAAKEVQTLQAEQQAAIDNLRKQYFRLQEATDKHAFLTENNYIKFDMLELQELLVKGGYIVPDELNRFDENNLENRMQRAADIFYEYVLNLSPEMLSPQHRAFFEAVSDNKSQTASLEEKHVNLSLATLSGTLVGLAQQAQSFRRDAKANDYPSEFYDRYLNPEDFIKTGGPFQLDPLKNPLKFMKTPFVRMERSYLNAWTTFQNQTKNFLHLIAKAVSEEKINVGAQLQALRALSALKFDAVELRNEISRNCGSNKRQFNIGQAVDALVGLAGSSQKPRNVKSIINRALTTLEADAYEQLSFTQKLEAVHALTSMTCYDLPTKQWQNVKFVARVIQDVDNLHYHDIANVLNFEQAEMLHEIHLAFKLAKSAEFSNKDLASALDHYERTKELFVENANLYDPLKHRVVAGLAQSLLKANVEYVHSAQEADTSVLRKNQYPFKPDLVVGYNGKKLGIFVVPDTQVMSDTMKCDGRTAHQMRLVELAHQQDGGEIQCICLPISEVVQADLKNFKLHLKEDFNIKRFLQENAKSSANLDFDHLSNLAASLSRKALPLLEKNQVSGKFENFLAELYHFFEGTQSVRVKSLHEPEQVDAAYDELRFQLCKLALLHEKTLSPMEKSFVQTSLPSKFKSFEALMEDAKSSLPKAEQSKLNDSEREKKLFFNSLWLGVRQEAELPVKAGSLKGKSLVPELLDRSFLVADDYHHYDDWKVLLEETYDQFNLLQVSPTASQNNPKETAKLYFDANLHKRRVPLGIFPLPNQKRAVLSPPQTATPVRKSVDEFAKFEQDPLDFMVAKELQMQSENKFKKITSSVSMIVNLQNVKHSLKADYSDGQVVKTILSNLSFTDKLIEEHLNSAERADAPQYVTRDPKAFRKFVTRPDKTQLQSQFSNFYISEALKQTRIHEIYTEVQDLEKCLLKENTVAEEAEIQNKIQALNIQMEDQLLENELENQGNFNLSQALENTVEVKYDLKSLGLDREASRPGQRAADRDLTDEQFLTRERCRAESKLIKSKIAYKVHSGETLTDQEKKYLQAWLENVTVESLAHPFDVLVPTVPSSLKISDLDAEDMYTLNALHRVEFDREKHGKYALNELITEIGHFLDPNTVRKIEQTVLQESLKEQWGLGHDFSLVDQRNKEVDLVLQELEETAWRQSGMFGDDEIENFKKMLKIGRGQDQFDRTYVDLDMQSFDEFLSVANCSDKRIGLLESWLLRKETEIKQRINLPTPDLAKPDSALNGYLEKHFKPAREKLVARMLESDTFGNAKVQKEYRDLSSDELHQLSEAISVRLNLFKQKYPSFLPQVVRGIMEHPNLQLSDRSHLDTYCKLFKLDWRGDQSVKNQEQWLFVNPVYMHQRDLDQQAFEPNRIIDEDVAKNMLSQACTPFLTDLAHQLRAQAK